jgi:hypothetical protein
MKRSVNVRLVLVGVVVIVIGIISWLSPGGLPRIGIHPLDLVNAVPGYAIVALGGVIVIIAFLLGLLTQSSQKGR